MPPPKVYGLPPNVVAGIPSQAELDSFPRMFIWDQLRTFILECDLGALKRNPELQQRYDKWNIELKKIHGTVERYILDVRLPKEFTETYNTPAPTRPATPRENNGADGTNGKAMKKEDGEWVKFEDLDAEDLLKGGKGMCLLPNDWPYNVPYGVRHSILWTRKPIFHKALLDHNEDAWAKVLEDGFSGLTGRPGHDDWYTPGGEEIHKIVKSLWNPEEFECAWFVNPPRLQSVRGLSHAHIFARNKNHASSTTKRVGEDQ